MNRYVLSLRLIANISMAMINAGIEVVSMSLSMINADTEVVNDFATES